MREHIKHIFEEGEMKESSVVRKCRTTASDWKNYETTFCNLDLKISPGYRIKSRIATEFRIWATEHLKEYIVKGFTINDERLKNIGGGSYWHELLNRIHDIRSSEKVLYRQFFQMFPKFSIQRSLIAISKSSTNSAITDRRIQLN